MIYQLGEKNKHKNVNRCKPKSKEDLDKHRFKNQKDAT